MSLKTAKLILFYFLSFAILSVHSFSQEKKIELKFGHYAPVGHNITEAVNKVADEIKKTSNGRIILNVFPASQLGNNRELVEQVSNGSLDFSIDGGAMLANWHKPMEIFEAPFFADNWSQMTKIMTSREALNMYAELEKKSNIKIVSSPWYNGVRHLTTKNKPINSIEDLKSLKIRVPQAPIMIDTISSLGAIATPMPFTEVYLALQTNAVDGQENPLGTINSGKFYEVQKYLAITGHVMNGMFILTNEKRWSKLSLADQKLILDAFNKGGVINNDLAIKGEKELIDKFKSLGMIVTYPNLQAFKNRMTEVYKKNTEKWGADRYESLSKYKN